MRLKSWLARFNRRSRPLRSRRRPFWSPTYPAVERLEDRVMLSCIAENGTWVSAHGGCLDTETGLVWGRQSDEVTGLPTTFEGTLNYGANLVESGFDDWRIPTKEELLTAVEHGIAEHVNVNTVGATWSSTEAQPGDGRNWKDKAWVVYLGSGAADLTSKGSNLEGLAVRDTSPAPLSTPGIRVFGLTEHFTSEGGDAVELSFVLNAEPTDDVTIGLSVSDTSEANLSADSLTFTPDNWNSAQTITITGLDDTEADGIVPYSIVTDPAVSNDPDFDGLDGLDVSLVNTDDEPEGGFVDTFVTPGDGGLAGPSGIAFGPGDDLFVAGEDSDQILRYDGGTGALVSEFVSPGTGGLDRPLDLAFGPDGNSDGVEELYVGNRATSSVLVFNGADGTFLDELTAPDDVSLTPSALTFGPDRNGDGVAELFVGNDAESSVLRFDGASGAFIDEFVPSGSGGLNSPTALGFASDGNLYVVDAADALFRYDGITGEFIDIFDNEPDVDPQVGLAIGPFGDLYAADQLSRNGQEIRRFDISSGEVTVVGAFVPYGTSPMWRPNALTFGPDGQLYASSFGSDSIMRFTGPEAPEPGITVSPTSGLITGEDGTSDAFDVVLDTQPSDDVTIGISSSDTTEGTVDQSSLTFTTDNWDTPQTVTVTGVDDTEQDGDIAYTIVTAAASSADADYNGLDPADVSVTNLDDDEPVGGVSVSEITPSMASPGDVLTVDVSGSGFQSGAALSFENASGPAPKASDVQVADDGASLTATVSVHKKAKLTSWDVVVTNPDGTSGSCDGCFEVVAALHIAGDGLPGGSGSSLLSDAALQSAVQQAAGFWQGIGASTDSLATFRSVDVRLADFSGSQLGAASASGTIWIDADAAGHGWSVGEGSSSGRVDLLSVMTHELGHVLGFGHDSGHDVMAPTLAPGTAFDRLTGEALATAESLSHGAHGSARDALGLSRLLVDAGRSEDDTPVGSPDTPSVQARLVDASALHSATSPAVTTEKREDPEGAESSREASEPGDTFAESNEEHTARVDRLFADLQESLMEALLVPAR